MWWFCNSFFNSSTSFVPKSFKRVANFYCVQVRAAFKNAAVTVRAVHGLTQLLFLGLLAEVQLLQRLGQRCRHFVGDLGLGLLWTARTHSGRATEHRSKDWKHKIRPCRLRRGAISRFILRSAAGNFILTSGCVHVQKQLLECAKTRSCEQTRPFHFLYANEELTSTYLGLSFCSVSADLGPW